MKLTKQEAIKLHREMWKIISEMSDEELKEFEKFTNKIYYIKRKAISKMGYGNILYSTRNCFCCAYAKQFSFDDCEAECPIKWYNDEGYCMDDTSPYYKLLYTKDFDTFRALAKEISELPERGN